MTISSASVQRVNTDPKAEAFGDAKKARAARSTKKPMRLGALDAAVVVEPQGQHGHGALLNVRFATIGPARGHGRTRLDATTLDQIEDLVRQKGGRLRAVYTHAHGERMERTIGVFMNFRRDGETVRSDLHFVEAGRAVLLAGREQPVDVVDRVVKLARDVPEAVGVSLESDDIYLEGSSEDSVLRLRSLDAGSIVSDAAANPNGLLEIGAETRRIRLMNIGAIKERAEAIPDSPEKAQFLAFLEGMAAAEGADTEPLETLNDAEPNETEPPAAPASEQEELMRNRASLAVQTPDTAPKNGAPKTEHASDPPPSNGAFLSSATTPETIELTRLRREVTELTRWRQAAERANAETRLCQTVRDEAGKLGVRLDEAQALRLARHGEGAARDLLAVLAEIDVARDPPAHWTGEQPHGGGLAHDSHAVLVARQHGSQVEALATQALAIARQRGTAGLTEDDFIRHFVEAETGGKVRLAVGRAAPKKE